MARIICDTMIWYGLADGSLDSIKWSSEPLTLTMVSVMEIATSYNLLKPGDTARNVIRSMMKYSSVTLFDNPFIYLARLSACPDIPDEGTQNADIFKATEMIAKGHEIEESKREFFKEWLDNTEGIFEKFADSTNENLEQIRSKITNKEAHAKIDTTEGVRSLIIQWANMSLDCDYKLIDWRNFELFEKTMASFYRELELHPKMKFQPNDFFDLMNLVYVQPGDKYFTLENRWIKRIKNAGMEGYLA